MARQRVSLAVLACAWLACLAPGVAVKADDAALAFAFALTGDAPYSEFEAAQFERMKARIDKADLAFVVHVGDFKSGASECSDELFRQRFALFDGFIHPFVYVFGDNDWTDCHRWPLGNNDPMERLARLRGMFTQGNASLGKRTIPLERQSDQKGYELYRENVRWARGGVVFAGLHVVGGGNNLRAGATAYKEFSKRNAANLAWLKQTFAQARQQNARAVMLFIQANPRFETDPKYRKGYNDFVALLEQETIAFAKPVVLVHGDTHEFRIDKPMKNPATGEPVANFTRVEVYGSPVVGWIKATVEPGRAEVFRFEAEAAD